MSILVLTEQSLTAGLRGQLEHHMRKVGLPMMKVRFAQGLTAGCTTRTGKKRITEYADPAKRDQFNARLLDALNRYQPTVIAINDPFVLEFVTERHRSLDLLRGSVYFINDIPAVVLDSLRTSAGMSKLRAVPYAPFLLRQDLKKLKRWHDGQQRTETTFAYRIVQSVADLREFVCDMERAILVGMDIETAGRGAGAVITCSGYAMLQTDGRIISWVVPLLSPLGEQGRLWSEAELNEVLCTLRHVHQLPVPKVMQNGSYDCHYFLRYRMPVRRYVLDTAVAFQSIWPELPKRLDFIASVACDHYRYWKDEGGSKADEKEDVKSGDVPRDEAAWNKYLRYNALDCHYTVLSTFFVLPLITKLDWAKANYCTRMRQTIGPALRMSMSGVRTNRVLQDQFAYENLNASEQALCDLRMMVADREFNPNSPQQVASLVYDVLRAQPVTSKKRGTKGGGGRTTEEKTLQLVQAQGPLLKRVIDQIWLVKKPKNNASKYGPFHFDEEKKKWTGLQLWNDRWYYQMNPTGTETERYASKSSSFWLGTQTQNVPYGVREMIEADEGYVMFDFDYSKADFWHTAFASEETNMMNACLREATGELDIHCFHASKFFAKDYDAIYAGYKKKEPWVVDSLHGVRQNAKRIVYGANYLMAGFTLLLTMGTAAVEATAQFMKHDTSSWGVPQYTKFCQSLLDFYFSTMYPELLPWLERALAQAANRNNIAVACGGNARMFFADLRADKAAQREFAAFFGQGGTARMINRAIDAMLYSGLWSQDLMLFFQVHDSVVGQVRKDKLHLLDELKRQLEVTNEINGRSFVVPVDGSVGYGWGHRMCDWHTGITLAEIQAADEKWRMRHEQQRAA